jgi:hypothetical protein
VNFTGTKIKINIAIFFHFLFRLTRTKKLSYSTIFSTSHFFHYFLHLFISMFLVLIDNHNYINTKISE